MRVWLLTCTTYATWLPGDPRGCVTGVRDRRPVDALTAARIEHDLPGTPHDGGMPGLRLSAAEAAGTPVYLTPRTPRPPRSSSARRPSTAAGRCPRWR